MRKILLTRDPVCMSDDMESHDLEIDVEENWEMTQILDKVLSMKYLPRIGGGEATWCVFYNKKPLAVIAQQWTNPRFVCIRYGFSDESQFKDFNKLNFKYCVQEDPELVFKVLCRIGSAFE